LTSDCGVLDEATLIARAQDGDPVAFERLVDVYQAPLFRHAHRMLADQTAAEDVVQEALITAWQQLPSLLQVGAFRGWLYQIVTRRSIDLLRRRRDHLPIDEHVENTAPAPAGPAPDSRIRLDPAVTHEHQAQWDALQRVLTDLPVLPRAIWSMREIDGLSYEEIGRATSLPVSTVRGRIVRTRRLVAERMSPWR
jgi:RNA polymerase sigma-70 factor (ECF subfamily)